MLFRSSKKDNVAVITDMFNKMQNVETGEDKHNSQQENNLSLLVSCAEADGLMIYSTGNLFCSM